MKYTEQINDLFSLDRNENMVYIQCISADFAMGAGIAVLFNKHFQTKQELLKAYPKTWEKNWTDAPLSKRGFCLYAEPTFNLVTKQNYWNKPTLQSLQNALIALREQVMERGIKQLACPQFGSGLDRLPWDMVREMIIETFQDTDVEFIVCGLKRTRDFPCVPIENLSQLEQEPFEMEYDQ